MLTRRQKTIFLLVQVHGYSQRETAEELGVSEPRVSQLLSAVLRKYTDARRQCPEVPEPQFRRAWLGCPTVAGCSN